MRPDLWVGLAPNGIGQQKPHHYREMAQVAWDNRAHPKYAWDVLSKGVCDGCALGVAGWHDWTQPGVHLCTTRLRLLEVNTADAVDPLVLADAEVSRHHARLEPHSGGWRVVDLDSTNGTWVNGARIRQAAIGAGDDVAFGGVRFRVAAA